MTLISKEDVQNIFNEMYEKMYEKNYKWELKLWLIAINSLPTFHDPIAVLKEMIEQANTKESSEALEEALSRITKQ